MGVTNPNGDPYVGVGVLEEHDLSAALAEKLGLDEAVEEADDGEDREPGGEWTFAIDEDQLEGLETPVLAVALRTAEGETVGLATVKEPLPGEWRLEGPGGGVDD